LLTQLREYSSVAAVVGALILYPESGRPILHFIVLDPALVLSGPLKDLKQLLGALEAYVVRLSKELGRSAGGSKDLFINRRH